MPGQLPGYWQCIQAAMGACIMHIGYLSVLYNLLNEWMVVSYSVLFWDPIIHPSIIHLSLKLSSINLKCCVLDLVYEYNVFDLTFSFRFYWFVWPASVTTSSSFCSF